MCMVSMVHQYHEKLPPTYWTHDTFDAMKDFLKKAEEYDEKTNQKDCLDPQKAHFLKDVEKLLEEKYGIAKKFDWEVGDAVWTKQEKSVINEKTLSYDITLRAGLNGKIAKIEHLKDVVVVWVSFDGIAQLVDFRWEVSITATNGWLGNESEGKRVIDERSARYHKSV